MLECPCYNSIRDRLIFLFHNVVLGCLKYRFQSDHRIDTTWCLFHDTLLYLTNATTLHYSRKLVFLTPSWCTPNAISHSLLGFEKQHHFIFTKVIYINKKILLGWLVCGVPIATWSITGTNVHWSQLFNFSTSPPLLWYKTRDQFKVASKSKSSL